MTINPWQQQNVTQTNYSVVKAHTWEVEPVLSYDLSANNNIQKLTYQMLDPPLVIDISIFKVMS